jgi:hypothetical protein
MRLPVVSCGATRAIAGYRVLIDLAEKPSAVPRASGPFVGDPLRCHVHALRGAGLRGLTVEPSRVVTAGKGYGVTVFPETTRPVLRPS